MTSDSTSMPPTTPTGPAPTTPFTSPAGPPVQNTPDSGYGNDDDTDSTSTIDSSLREGIAEYGRTYHAYRPGHLQHKLFLLTLYRERVDAASDAASDAEATRVLHLSPLSKSAPSVLDVGTGTGMWALDFGDKYAAARVKGIDLSPIQPQWVTPNVHFVVDDIEEPWPPSETYDFIHARMMFGALQDWPRFLRNCSENMKPDGWVEVSGPHLPFGCDDNSLPRTSFINKWSSLTLKASVTLKRPIDIAPKLKEMMHDAGFINIVEKTYKWPVNKWPEDERAKELGFYTNLNLVKGVEGFSMKFFTIGLGWTPAEVMVLSARVKNELKCTSIHAYLNIHVVFGQKPGL